MIAKTHEPVISVIGLYDGTPFVTIETHCTCGVRLSAHTFDMRTDPESAGEQIAGGDAEAFARHVKEVA